MLSAVVDLGITHIDTSDYYGPHTANELIREALHPYPAGLHIVTKIGARRGPDKSWPAALSRDELVQAVHDNLEHLGLESLDLVNLRMTDSREAATIAGPFSVLAGLAAATLPDDPAHPRHIQRLAPAGERRRGRRRTPGRGCRGTQRGRHRRPVRPVGAALTTSVLVFTVIMCAMSGAGYAPGRLSRGPAWLAAIVNVGR